MANSAMSSKSLIIGDLQELVHGALKATKVSKAPKAFKVKGGQ